ncbi:bacteriocin immunity protein [Enterococcus faecium]|uniref:bacteriocin immunity protein n=1 Tax=Enterococcus faecium TaxID=1352 RepID=UPI00190ED3B2|nr:bacteriocin immunity protein [Enterococcus faecium]MBK4818606.1 bacteriocin immunity protein [Enterococcus faecium]
MKNNKFFNKILELTETALATPEIKKDKNLCEILEKIKDSAAKGEFYYDYKKEFQPAISGFTIRNGFSTPKVLLELLAEVKTPKAWSGL